MMIPDRTGIPRGRTTCCATPQRSRLPKMKSRRCSSVVGLPQQNEIAVFIARQASSGSLELDATMKKVFLLGLALSLALLGCKSPGDSSTSRGGRTVSLFDGKTFQGWEGDTNKTFRIQDRAIVAGTMNARIPRNE